MYIDLLIIPWCVCAARVTVVGSVCLCVSMSVKSHLTSGASVRPENTERATEVEKFVRFSLKLLGCRDPALLC